MSSGTAISRTARFFLNPLLAQIFLDYLSALASQTGEFLLERKFQACLSKVFSLFNILTGITVLFVICAACCFYCWCGFFVCFILVVVVEARLLLSVIFRSRRRYFERSLLFNISLSSLSALSSLSLLISLSQKLRTRATLETM
jgi:hypothetical protein